MMVRLTDKLAVNRHAVSHLTFSAPNLTIIHFSNGHHVAMVGKSIDEVIDQLDPNANAPYDELADLLSPRAMKRASGEPEE